MCVVVSHVSSQPEGLGFDSADWLGPFSVEFHQALWLLTTLQRRAEFLPGHGCECELANTPATCVGCAPPLTLQ